MICPQSIKEVTTGELKYAPKYAPIFMCEFIKNGIVFAEGAPWQEQRNLIATVFNFEVL